MARKKKARIDYERMILIILLVAFGILTVIIGNLNPVGTFSEILYQPQLQIKDVTYYISENKMPVKFVVENSGNVPSNGVSPISVYENGVLYDSQDFNLGTVHPGSSVQASETFSVTPPNSYNVVVSIKTSEGIVLIS